MVEFFPECFPECPAYNLEVCFVLADALGAVGEEYPVDVAGKDRPISEKLGEVARGGGPVPALSDALTNIESDIEGGLFALVAWLTWPT